MNPIQEKGTIRPSCTGPSQASNQAEEEHGEGSEEGGDADRGKPVTSTRLSTWALPLLGGLDLSRHAELVMSICLDKAQKVG